MREIAAWLYRSRKLAAGVVPVLVLWVLPESWISFEVLQLWIAMVTLPVTVLFIVAYAPERPHRHWFGSSLMLIAWAVLFWSASVVLYRLLGSDYWARPYMVKASVSLTLAAMIMRTCVLLADQAQDERGLGWWITRQRLRLKYPV